MRVDDRTDRLIGHRVRMRRLMLGMTQSQLAQVLGVTFQQFQKYEKGENRISASRIQLLARSLGVPVSFFFDPCGDKLTDDIASFLATHEGLRLAKAFHRITGERIRRSIVLLVQKLANSKTSEDRE
jgi:transcriptional regulator with XRE-family HTH domain